MTRPAFAVTAVLTAGCFAAIVRAQTELARLEGEAARLSRITNAYADASLCQGDDIVTSAPRSPAP